MHFLVKVMLFSTENTIFLYSPGRHPLFRAKVDGSFRWFPQEHDFKRPQITKVKIMYVISSAHKPQISGRRGSGGRREATRGLGAQRGCRGEQFRDLTRGTNACPFRIPPLPSPTRAWCPFGEAL